MNRTQRRDLAQRKARAERQQQRIEREQDQRATERLHRSGFAIDEWTDQ